MPRSRKRLAGLLVGGSKAVTRYSKRPGDFGSSGRLDGLFEHFFRFLRCSISGLFEIQPATVRPTVREKSITQLVSDLL